MRTNCAWNGPTCTGPSSGTASISSASAQSPCSSSFDLTSPSVSFVAQTSGAPISRRKYGSAPTWSSWPCVRTTARILSRRSSSASKSGQDEIDAEVLVAREREAGVDDHDAALALDHGHVLADLAEAAERRDSRPGHEAV